MTQWASKRVTGRVTRSLSHNPKTVRILLLVALEVLRSCPPLALLMMMMMMILLLLLMIMVMMKALVEKGTNVFLPFLLLSFSSVVFLRPIEWNKTCYPNTWHKYIYTNIHVPPTHTCKCVIYICMYVCVCIYLCIYLCYVWERHKERWMGFGGSHAMCLLNHSSHNVGHSLPLSRNKFRYSSVTF